MSVHGWKKSIAQVHRITKDPLSRPRHPECLNFSQQGLHIGNGLWSLLPVDLILRKEQTDEALPRVGQLISFNIEVGDRGVSAEIVRGFDRRLNFNGFFRLR